MSHLLIYLNAASSLHSDHGSAASTAGRGPNLATFDWLLSGAVSRMFVKFVPIPWALGLQNGVLFLQGVIFLSVYYPIFSFYATARS